MDQEVYETKSSIKEYLAEFIQTLAVCLVIGIIVYLFIAQPHKVSGISMFPNFHNNDYIITNKLLYRFSEPQRGDIIVLRNPKHNSEDFIKRIIGLSGERVKIQNGRVFINGQMLQESYLDKALLTPPGSFMQEGREVIVPNDSFLVLGDNRTASSDSREWGFVPKSDVIGKVFLRYWPQQSIGLI
ncbi:MAG: Signal peptidase I [Candidatus Daviesbacteria bacterium GW2011_GWA2_38_24]|uniref:Signal peptidase I n=1 Tax=Candidatus Daviesbacteria bacterium GW2011_GWA2_38_24 TaxID=1618422 RepID=A0A0G0MQG1_9BACT|nr:MAG: Signal peptidase I [Candidatus Daviesbacteria bacterium GW2011_GWA2_38_24]KKQ79188.1 MAG: Signal peptidase I [Candidatus Daviesbacteria bacterium GW2011_GWA1_38_7]OGE23120.1 MAG: signal peptidase I [Candidatus Daviesbacteria bacterium RIFCSPHIGHO2_01_FULL_38_8]